MTQLTPASRIERGSLLSGGKNPVQIPTRPINKKNNLFFKKRQERVISMKFKKVVAQFKSENIDLAEGLICDIFFSFHLKGVIRPHRTEGNGEVVGKKWMVILCHDCG